MRRPTQASRFVMLASLVSMVGSLLAVTAPAAILGGLTAPGASFGVVTAPFLIWPVPMSAPAAYEGSGVIETAMTSAA